MKELNKDLRDQAVHLGLCQEWQNLWSKDWSREKMVEQMYKGLDFCLKHHYPSNDYILKHFDQDFRRQSNVFVNDKYSVINPKQSLTLGNSDITYRFNATAIGNVHIRDNATARVFAKNRSFVIVHIYDKATVMAQQFDKAKIIVIKHSKEVKVIAEANVTVKEEYDYLK